jgi:hypothetical protein
MKPLKTLTQAVALGGLALTGYGFITDEFHALQTFVLAVFFFWAHVYAHAEIDL